LKQLRARFPHLAGSAAKGAGAGRHHHDRGSQSLARRNLWPERNAAFAVAPAEAGSAFVRDRTGRVGEILCIREERRVGNHYTETARSARR